MNILIESGINKTILRRLNRETKLFLEKSDKLAIEFISKNEIKLNIFVKNDIYSFIVTESYPFVSPNAFINDLNVYKNLFYLPTNRFKKILNYLTGFECLCCETYLCPKIWNPTITLLKTFEQLKEFRTHKYHIFIKILADQIKEKYLNRDINLDQWLFKTHLRQC